LQSPRLVVEVLAPIAVRINIEPCDKIDGKRSSLESANLVFEGLNLFEHRCSTELKDRTWKLQNYIAHPTIEEYMLVSARSLK